MKIFAGNSVPELAKLVSDRLCIQLGDIVVGKFNDGEINVKINESVRGEDIFIIQSICHPVNDNLMELLIMINAFRYASARQIVAVIPYFGYARQDKSICFSRISVTSKLVADLLCHVGVNRVLTVDLHTEYISSFFNVPVDNIFGGFVFYKDILNKKLNNFVLVSPDIGGLRRIKYIAKFFKYKIDIAYIDKHSCFVDDDYNSVCIVGDVKNRNCIVLDDVIDTGRTLCTSVNILKNNEANKIFIYITHPVFSSDSCNIVNNLFIDQINVCDTVVLTSKVKKIRNLKIITLSDVISKAIICIYKSKSIFSVFGY